MGVPHRAARKLIRTNAATDGFSARYKDEN